MKKFTFTLSLLLAVSLIFGQNIQQRSKNPAQSNVQVEKSETNRTIALATDYAIDFEDTPDFSLTFDPWSVADVDGLNTYGFTDITFPNSGSPMAFIAFNPDETDPPMSDDTEIQPHSGERFGACMAAVPSGGQGNNDWLMTPLIEVGDGASINMWAKSYTDEYGLERFNVAVSTTTNDPGEFDVISGPDYLEAPIVWTAYNFDLSAYAGMEIYVGIQCVSNDAFVFMVDDIVVDPGTTASDCDNFDNLAVGDYVAEQLPMWTTWSGTPGSTEDALVTDAYAHSAPNSFVVEGTTDLIRLFAEETITEGSYKISFNTYIPAGYFGYWNLQKTIVPGDEWGLEVYLRDDGTAQVDANGGDNAQFLFNHDEWFYTEVIVDIDQDLAQLYVEGNLVIEYPWHLGATGSGTLYSLGSMNLWAWNDEGATLQYFDDVCFEPHSGQPADECNDFEQYDDFALNFDPWMTIDVDGLGTYGFTGITFPNAYEPMSFIAFDPAQTDPPMTDDVEIQPYEGEQFAACFASVPSGGQGNNDWLISPFTQLGTESALSFYAKSYTDEYGMERFNVGVSTTGTDPADFTIINGGDYLEAPMAWTEYEFDLSDYDNQEVYIAIQCVSYDAFVFMVDNVCILSNPTGIENTSAGNFNLYPNPAKDMVSITSTDKIEEISIFNAIGKISFYSTPDSKEVQFNTSELESGIYFVRIKTAAGIETAKLLVE